MFRNRAGQKPSDELYSTFKQAFPELALGTSASSSVSPSVVHGQRSASLSDATAAPNAQK